MAEGGNGKALSKAGKQGGDTKNLQSAHPREPEGARKRAKKQEGARSDQCNPLGYIYLIVGFRFFIDKKAFHCTKK
jgi:hypothetical protein